MLESAAEDRFWSKVRRHPTECWEWQSGKMHEGYGMFWLGKKQVRAHRVAWMFAEGQIPEGLSVLHACDNPGCVRPSHLFLGTQKKNMEDMIAKRRGHDRSGERNGQSKLTEQDVLAIRESSEMGKDLASRYGVSQAAISVVKSRKYWRHI